MKLEKFINKKTKLIGMLALGSLVVIAAVLLIIFSPSGKNTQFAEGWRMTEYRLT